MEYDMLPRRSMMSSLGAAVAAFALGSRTAGAQTAARRFQPARHPQDAWLDAVAGKHRTLIDAATTNGAGEGMLYANNLYEANKSGYSLPEGDIGVVVCLRHFATAFAFNDAIWAKYGKTISAIVKDIHYHPTTYVPQHIDFLVLETDTAVSVNVPIVVLGAAECPGIKLGGFARQPIRALTVKCLPKDIPQQFFLNIQDLQLAQSKRLSDIEVPSSVKPMAKNMNEVAIVIAKR